MSKTGLIYEIVCNETYERYVGSTFEPTVARRVAAHRKISNECSIWQIIERNNYSYGLLETVMVDTRDELRMYERKWYDALDCINKFRPYVTEEETKQNRQEYCKKYKEEHKEQLNLKNKEYYQENKEQVKEYMKAYNQEHKEQKNEYMKAYRLKQKEQTKEYNIAYRLKQKALKSSALFQPLSGQL